MSVKNNNFHLEYLDGIRGVAAFYVTLNHVYFRVLVIHQETVYPPLAEFMKLFSAGRFSVAVFIVLSGYCLMLPVIRSEDGKLRGGILNFLKRRARRILPPYYAAICLTLLMIVPLLILTTFYNYNHPNTFVPTLGAIISHILLIHNLNKDWVYAIDGPTWSVASEWQIYFIFAILALPFWRNFGIINTVVLAFVIGLAPRFLLNGLLDQACPWYLGLFALGMAAAVIGFSRKLSIINFKKKFLWGKFSFGLHVLLLILFVFTPINHLDYVWIFDFLAGLAVLCTLVYATEMVFNVKENQNRLFLNIFESRILLQLGTFSYSLYLVHDPILSVFYNFSKYMHLNGTAISMLLLVIGIPSALVFSYLFYLVFEKPFLAKKNNQSYRNHI